MSTRIAHIDSLPYIERTHGDHFSARFGMAAVTLGAQELGYNVTVVPPGTSPGPRHAHHANEEMLFVISGTGVIRIGAEEFPLEAGHLVCLPAGSEHAHQVFNRGDDELRFLAVSTMRHPEVIEYPDSGKLATIAGAAPGRPHSERTVSHYTPVAAAVDYWDGETGD